MREPTRYLCDNHPLHDFYAKEDHPRKEVDGEMVVQCPYCMAVTIRYLNEKMVLFKKYINHVGECEGIDFTGNSLTCSDKFTDEEKKDLRIIAKAAWEESQ
jgi:uncharacterized C2H2 Zn-finger protein